MKALAFDLETYLIRPGVLAPKPVCGSFATSEEAGLLTYPEVADLLKLSLFEGGTNIVGANIAFDFGVVSASTPSLVPAIFAAYDAGRVWDVQIAQSLIDIAEGHLGLMPDGSPIRIPRIDGTESNIQRRYSLECCVWLLTGRHDAKINDTWRLRYAELDGIPFNQWPREAKQYPIDDAKNTLDCYVAQQGKPNLGLVEGKTFTHLTLQTRAAFAMHLASMWGLKTDPVRVAALEERIKAQDALNKERLKKLGLVDIDGKKIMSALKTRVAVAHGADIDSKCPTCQGKGKVISPKTKGKINCKDCDSTGIVLPSDIPRTAAGAVAADRDTFSECDDPILMEYVEAAKNDKLLETYIPFLQEGVNTRINVRPNVLVESGRASYDGLIQLIPRDGGVRECFIPTPGRVFCSVDYAALELCTLAQSALIVVGRSKMADAINESKDPGALHTIFAARMLNRDPEEFKALVKAGDKGAKLARQMAKAANFGFPGGMGPAKLVLAKRKEGLRFCTASGLYEKCGERMSPQRNGPAVCAACEAIAKKLREQWFQTWPEMESYFAHISALPALRDNQAVLISPGTGYQRGGLGFSNAANHPFQHLASCGAKHALWNVSRECYTDRASPLFGSRPVLFAHDEIIAELPEGKAHEAAHRMADIMVSSMREFVPDVHVSAEPALMRYWTKAAEPKYVDGRLVPWEK